MTADTERSQLADWLANHPRMLGALFVLVTLLAQAGNTVAASSSGVNGP